MANTTVGFISLGAMGSPMATLIQNACGNLTVHSRRKESAEHVLNAGATWADSPAEVAHVSDVVITMLPDIPELHEVVYHPGGLIETTRPIVLVACSTSSPSATREFGRQVAADSGGLIELVDAPVSGGVEGAKEGSLSIFLGGSEPACEAAASALEPCGTSVRLGELGAGQVAKAANQHIVAATTVALAEALVMAERSGLDLATLVPLLAGGYAGSRLLQVKGRQFIEHDHTPASPAKFMIKDLSFAQDAATDTGTHTPVLDAATEVFTTMVAAGLGDLDSSGTQEYLLTLTPGDQQGRDNETGN